MNYRPPVTLEGQHVRLVPVTLAHARPLLAVAHDPEIWTWTRFGALDTVEKMEEQIRRLQVDEERGEGLSFTVLLREGDRPIGMTRFLAISRPDLAVEIGGTWYGRAYWRTAVNTECKYLLLRHAFDVEDTHRVQLKTDLNNLRSQRAIERIGAVREGILREHLLLGSGRFRTSVFYSILRPEWPEVKAALERMLERPWQAPA
jgi:N-acetyltransferase